MKSGLQREAINFLEKWLIIGENKPLPKEKENDFIDDFNKTHGNEFIQRTPAVFILRSFSGIHWRIEFIIDYIKLLKKKPTDAEIEKFFLFENNSKFHYK